MAKRSPILGYNHNVRYRGLVFHVQTEDSGVLSPHLFTHLFYQGVIVSTRKLVYDAGASEDAIKALMQAQHKAVLKDLKIHTFDDKIDQYLGTTEGLEPREPPANSPEAKKRPTGQLAPLERPPAPTPVPDDPVDRVARIERIGAATVPDVATAIMAEAVAAITADLPDVTDLAVPDERAETEPTPPAIEFVIESTPPPLPVQAATKTEPLPPPMPPAAPRDVQTGPAARQFVSITPPTGAATVAATAAAATAALVGLDDDGAVALEVNAGPTIPTQMPSSLQGPPTVRMAQPSPPRRAATPPPVPPPARITASTKITTPDSSPEIEIIRGDDTIRRVGRDTEVELALVDDSVPAPVTDDLTRPSDGVPGRITIDPPVQHPTTARSLTPGTPGARPASHAAGALPPMRPPSRPSMTPAPLTPRPTPSQVDAVPPPPDPHGFDGPTERPGQYSMKGRGPDNVTARATAVPAGLGRPRPGDRPSTGKMRTVQQSEIDARAGSKSQPPQNQPQPVPAAAPPSGPAPQPQPPVHTAPQSHAAHPPQAYATVSPATAAQPHQVTPRSSVPETQPFPRQAAGPETMSFASRASAQRPSDGVPIAPDPKAAATTRTPHLTAPITSRTPAGGSAVATSGSVVRNRPAVIVGAPKPVGAPTQQRIRKAFEDEGRGFGQGLISEKSLDEVILAYLSEDADDKK